LYYKISFSNRIAIDEIVVNSNRLTVIDPLTSTQYDSDYLTRNDGFRSYITVADVNGDFVKDVVLANDSQAVKVFLGNPTNIYKFNTAPQISKSTSAPRGVIVAKLDNNSTPDIIVGDAFSGIDIKLQVDPIALGGSVVRQLFEYDPNFGQLTKSTDEEDRVTEYVLNSTGDVLQIKRGTGGLNVTKFEYDTHGLVTKIIDPDKYFTSTAYDGFGRVLTVKQGNDNIPSITTTISTLTYLDNSGNVGTKTDANGKTTQYTYKPNTNWIDRETYADGLGYSDYQYYADGLLKSVISSDGYGQEFTYNGLGKVLTIIDRTAKGNILRTNAYDLAGNLQDVISTVDSVPQTTRYRYDSRNRLTKVDNFDGSQIEYDYYVGSPNTKTRDVDGTTTEYTYGTTLNDSRLRLINVKKQIEGSNYQTTTYTHQKDLQIDTMTDSVGKQTIYKYDDLARKIEVTQELDKFLADGVTNKIINQTSYFANGNIESVKDGRGNTTTYTYQADRNFLAKTTDADSKNTTYTYDGVGNMHTMTDARGNTTTYGYDALNRRNKVTNALNEVTLTKYDLSGNITEVKDALDRITRYNYDRLNRQLTITTDGVPDTTIIDYDELGRIKKQKLKGISSTNDRITNYTYDDFHNLTTIDRPEGVTEKIQQDSRGNIIKTSKKVNGINQITRSQYNGLNQINLIIDADGNTQTFEYNSLGNRTFSTAKDSVTGETHTTQYESNNLGWNAKTTDAEGRVFTTTYDAVGNIKQQVENGLRTITHTYDALNRKTQVTTVYGADTLDTFTTYDEVGNVIKAKDAEGNTTQYRYDELNRQKKVIDAKLQDTDYVYDAVGNLKEIIDTPIRKTIYTYDNLNRRTEVKDAENIRTSTAYNEFGEAIAMTQNYGGIDTRTTQYKYDKLGRKQKTIDPLNHTTITTYDEANNVRTVTDANNNTTTYDYDKLNRQTKIIDANNITTQINTYDGFGNVKSIKDASANLTQYDYDLLNRLTKTIDPRNKETIQSYDGLSRVESIKDRNNRTRTFAYDINDNLTTEKWNGIAQITYAYDKVSNLKSSSDASSNTTNTYGYDAIYQLTSAATSNSNIRFEYDYDEFGDLTQRKDKQGTSTIAQLDYTYNNNHQLTQLTQSGVGLATQTIEMSYDRLSQLRKIDRVVATNPGHLVTNYDYDGAGRLFDINNKFNTTVISNYNYGYDDGNRLSGKNGTDGISTVAYGNDNQISSVNNATRPDESYSFNALGIRSGWTTDPLDKRRVLSDGTYQYQYDDEGNLTQKKEISTGKVTTYVWDYRNRLSRVNLDDGSIVEYGYDAQDKRVSKKINGVVKEKYVYDGDDIALAVNAVGTIVERYLYGGGVDNVLSRVSAGTTVWSLGDRQGSIVDLVDESGNVLNHFVYDSFGNRTATTAADFRYGYTGRELDGETGLYYYRARYYDSSLGRFISEDPVGFSAGDTNLYRYVNNNPTNYNDPSGNFPFLIAAGMVAMGVMNALIDVNIQLAINRMTDRTDMNWASVGVSFATGMIGFGLAQKATQASTLAWKIASNPLTQRAVDSGIDGVGKIVENTINGKPLHNELLETVAGNFILGAAAEAGIKGAATLAASAFKRFNGTIGAAHISMFSKQHVPYIENGRYIYSDEALVDRAQSLHKELVAETTKGSIDKKTGKLTYRSAYDSRTIAVGRARKFNEETNEWEYHTLYSSSTGSFSEQIQKKHFGLDPKKGMDISDYGEISTNVNLKEFKPDGFGIIDNVHRSHAELNMIQWAQKRGYIIEGIGVSHGSGVCPHCYAQMMNRGISTSNALFGDFDLAKPRKIPTLPSSIPEGWEVPSISYPNTNGIITMNPNGSTTVRTHQTWYTALL
jgi:RHS repeat-associated protein